MTGLYLLLAVIVGLAITRAQESGNATGTLTVGSFKLVLSHAYAFPQKGYYDPAKEDYRVFVTDQPFPASALKDEFEREELLLERRIQGLDIVVTADNRVVSGQLYHPALGATGLSVSGVHQFKAAALDTQKVAGKLFMERPLDDFGKIVQYEASVKELDGPDGKEILQMLPIAISRTMTITAIDVTGDTALVFAEDQKGKGAQKIKLALVREKDQWKVTQPVKP